jgi:hypothetical protein
LNSQLEDTLRHLGDVKEKPGWDKIMKLLHMDKCSFQDDYEMQLGLEYMQNPKWYSKSGHSEKHVIRTSFKEVSNDPKTKTIFKSIQDRCC